MSPDLSPVNMRPVRLEPWAPGARPRMRTAAAGSPKEGTGRPQYSQSRQARRFTWAIRAVYSIRRGQRRQVIISFCRIGSKRGIWGIEYGKNSLTGAWRVKEDEDTGCSGRWFERKLWHKFLKIG